MPSAANSAALVKETGPSEKSAALLIEEYGKLDAQRPGSIQVRTGLSVKAAYQFQMW
jgi:hypothetical protein